MSCPVCGNLSIDEILFLECGKFDDSPIYDPLRIATCTVCGHVYNLLTENEILGLMQYYETEYAMNNLYSPNINGDTPGSIGRNSVERYALLYEFISGWITRHDRVLDVGCAAGGFLQTLKKMNYRHLSGIEFSEPYVEAASKLPDIEIKKGIAEEIPYDNDSFDFVVADQVVEHLADPSSIFKEARRVLDDRGLLCISVPNAIFYEETHFFDFYWFLMREHIQHFDLIHLAMIAEKHGFTLIDSKTTFSNMISDRSILPNLSTLFMLKDTNVCRSWLPSGLGEKMKSYIKTSYEDLNKKRRFIGHMADTKMPLYVYGIGREFMYLYKNTRLPECEIPGLIDDTKYKQDFLKFDGRNILGSEFIKYTSENVIITATAHSAKLKARLNDLDVKGKIIEI